MSDKIIINQYKDQNYSTIFNQETGVFFRIENRDYPEPYWCSYGPELIDISITNWCDRMCDFCYKKSHASGIHMDIKDYECILKQAKNMKVSQIALGGGNPNQHPDFPKILRLTREKYNIVPSYTTNGQGLSDSILDSSKEYCGAVAISAYEPYSLMKEGIDKLLSRGIKTNIHYLLTMSSIDTAIKWLEEESSFLDSINAIVFLNYKPISRLATEYELAKFHPRIKYLFELIQDCKYKVGFDSCSISGIVKYLDVENLFIESCEAARFSMYISEELYMYPCSFAVETHEGVSIKDSDIQEIWRESNLFTGFRANREFASCNGCAAINVCSGGCPIFPEINFC